MTTVLRIRPLLKIDRNITASVLGRAYAVNSGMSAAPTLFAAPSPPLPTLASQIAKVNARQQLVAARVMGAAAARDVEREALVLMLETERSYVQTLCDATPAQAVAIVAAAGMVVAPAPVRENPLLKVITGPKSGSAVLDANVTVLVGRSGKKACFNWQWTTDGGATFHDAPSTPHGETTITGLTPFAMVGFRVSITDRNGTGDWSPIVTILIL